MKHAILLMMIICSSGISAQIDSIRKLPQVFQERYKTINVTHQAINLQFDWKQKQAFGNTAIALTFLSAANDARSFIPNRGKCDAND